MVRVSLLANKFSTLPYRAPPQVSLIKNHRSRQASINCVRVRRNNVVALQARAETNFTAAKFSYKLNYLVIGSCVATLMRSNRPKRNGVCGLRAL